MITMFSVRGLLKSPLARACKADLRLSRASWRPRTRSTVRACSSSVEISGGRLSLQFSTAQLLANLCTLAYYDIEDPVFWTASASPEYLEKVFAKKTIDLRDWMGDPDQLRKNVLKNSVFDTKHSYAFLPDAKDKEDTPQFGLKEVIKKTQEVFVWRLKTPNVIVVCFRGTNPIFTREFIDDALADGSFELERWPCVPADAELDDVKVHSGFASGYDAIADKVLKAVEDVYTATAGDGAQAPEVIVTGHSLGGALATLCSVDMSHKLSFLFDGSSRSSRLKCLTFGCPRVGNKSFTDLVNLRSPNLSMVRAINRFDIVPRVPPMIEGNLFRRFFGYDDKFGYTLWLKDPGPIPVEIPAGADFPDDFEGVNLDIILDQIRPATPKEDDKNDDGSDLDIDHADYTKVFNEQLSEKMWPFQP